MAKRSFRFVAALVLSTVFTCKVSRAGYNDPRIPLCFGESRNLYAGSQCTVEEVPLLAPESGGSSSSGSPSRSPSASSSHSGPDSPEAVDPLAMSDGRQDRVKFTTPVVSLSRADSLRILCQQTMARPETQFAITDAADDITPTGAWGGGIRGAQEEWLCVFLRGLGYALRELQYRGPYPLHNEHYPRSAAGLFVQGATLGVANPASLLRHPGFVSDAFFQEWQANGGSVFALPSEGASPIHVMVMAAPRRYESTEGDETFNATLAARMRGIFAAQLEHADRAGVEEIIWSMPGSDLFARTRKEDPESRSASMVGTLYESLAQVLRDRSFEHIRKIHLSVPGGGQRECDQMALDAVVTVFPGIVDETPRDVMVSRPPEAALLDPAKIWFRNPQQMRVNWHSEYVSTRERSGDFTWLEQGTFAGDYVDTPRGSGFFATLTTISGAPVYEVMGPKSEVTNALLAYRHEPVSPAADLVVFMRSLDLGGASSSSSTPTTTPAPAPSYTPPAAAAAASAGTPQKTAPQIPMAQRTLGETPLPQVLDPQGQLFATEDVIVRPYNRRTDSLQVDPVTGVVSGSYSAQQNTNGGWGFNCTMRHEGQYWYVTGRGRGGALLQPPSTEKTSLSTMAGMPSSPFAAAASAGAMDVPTRGHLDPQNTLFGTERVTIRPYARFTGGFQVDPATGVVRGTYETQQHPVSHGWGFSCAMNFGDRYWYVTGAGQGTALLQTAGRTISPPRSSETRGRA